MQPYIHQFNPSDWHNVFEQLVMKKQPLLLKNFLPDSQLDNLVEQQGCSLKPLYSRGAVPFLYLYFHNTTIKQHIFNLPIIKQLIDDNRCQFRENMRLWQHDSGNLSRLHYDQRSTDLFNIYLRGEKQWRFAAPDAPIRCWPFYNIALPFQTKREVNWVEFTMQAGDLVYIPRNWYHQVQTTQNDTRNINIIFNDLTNGYLPKREKELAAMRYQWLPNYVYGDNNPAINQTLAQVPTRNLLSRLAKESWPLVIMAGLLSLMIS